MIIDLDDGDSMICPDDPIDPWVSCEDSPPGFGQIAIFMCGNGKKRVGYGRGIELGPALFFEPEDRYEVDWPFTLKCWKKGPEPTQHR